MMDTNWSTEVACPEKNPLIQCLNRNEKIILRTGSMKNYIALLRGINVNGQKTIRMADLQTHLGELGWQGIRTYVQSGNVIFSTANEDAGHLARKITWKLQDKYGFEVPTLVLDPENMLQVIHYNPYVRDPATITDRLYVTFLFDRPHEDRVRELRQIEQSGEHFTVEDQIIYLYYPDGYGRALMDNNAFERALKVKATTRNWKTVNKLYELAQT